MPQDVRKLALGEVIIGFMTPDGKLIGEFAEARVGHEALSLRTEGLRAKLASGQAVAITLGKSATGAITVFGSGAFVPPGGKPLSEELKDRARRLVE
jgi:hypothetical protein